jgi:outer membrane immunogenic protein
MRPTWRRATPRRPRSWRSGPGTSFYIGLNGGYSWGRSDTTGTFYNALTGVQIAPTQGGVINLDGWVFGGQVGKNWQFNSWVVGLEADGQWTDEKGRRGLICATGLVCNNLTFGPRLNVPPTATFNQEISWFATFRGRAGFLATPTALFYATGGLAVAGIKTDGVINAFNAASAPVAVAWVMTPPGLAGWSVRVSKPG